MSETIQRIRVFLASPGDVAAEREAVRRVATEINSTLGMDSGFVINVVGWETDVVPEYGGDPQGIINRRIAEMGQYELFVGIMWNRFGQPTPRAGSGSEEEFQRAVESLEQSGRPWIMLYFNEAPSSLGTQAELEQRGKVLLFKERVRKLSVTKGYDGPADFEARFRQDLTRWLGLRATSAARPPVSEEPAAAPARPAQVAAPAEVRSSEDWVLLGSGFFRANSVREAGGRTLIRVTPDTPEEEAAVRALAPGQYGASKPVPYAYQNTAYLARVSAVDAESVGGQTSLEIALAPDGDARRSNVTEMSYNGMSVDELATLRARLILLDEQPARGSGFSDQTLRSMVEGFSGIEIREGAFKALWRETGGDPGAFLRMARLWAAFLLVATGTCESILELALGPVRDGEMQVRFRGRRRRTYANVPAAEIAVEGTCRLEASR